MPLMTRSRIEEMTQEELIERARRQSRLGRLLEELRLKNNFSFREAEKATGVSHTYIRNVENGVDPRSGKSIFPNIEILKKFANGYGVSYETLLEAAGYSTIENNKQDEEAAIKKIRDELFHNRLSILLANSKLPLDEISRKTEMSCQLIEDIKHREVEPKLEEIYNLAAVFGVTPDYLSGYVDQPDATHPDMPKLQDMIHFINNSGVQLFGQPLSREQKSKLDTVLQAVFYDAFQKNIQNK